MRTPTRGPTPRRPVAREFPAHPRPRRTTISETATARIHDINPESVASSARRPSIRSPISSTWTPSPHEGTSHYHRLHALSIFDGTEQRGGPLLVTCTYPGGGVGSSGGVLNFSHRLKIQSAAPGALYLISNGQLFIAYSRVRRHRPLPRLECFPSRHPPT